MNSTLIHLDSIYSQRNYDANNTSGSVLNPFNTSFKLNTQFKNIKKFSLESVELGCGFPSIRTGSTNLFKFIVNDVTYSFTIPEANYLSINAVVQAINSATGNIVSASGCLIVFAVTNTNTIQISSTATSMSVIPTNFSQYILGIQSTDFYIGGYIVGSGTYNLNPDNYLNIYIPEIGSTNISQIKTTFKLPLNSVTNQIYYFSSGYGFHQEIINTNSGLILDKLNVVITDRFGCNLNPIGLEWSATIRIYYDT